jgi:hypothetical protein
MNILQAMGDPALFGLKGPTWDAWRAALAAIFALPITKEQLAVYRTCTGRSEPPTAPASEFWAICGRRSGKSFILALIAVYLACLMDWRKYLGPGERGTIMVIASDRKQSRVIMRYIAGLLEVPMLAARVESQSTESVDLQNRVTIEVHPASYRSVRGYTVIAALADELAFWRSDETSANPDTEILEAIRPAMVTIPNAMLLCASSPHARKGALWDAWKAHYGKDGPILVWHAPTRVMHARVPQLTIDRAMERDPARANAEWHAIFRADVESFIPREVVEALVSPGVYERAPIGDVRSLGFVDPSGGGHDSYTLAIAHAEGDIAVLDLVRERRPPFGPEEVTDEYARTLQAYGVHSVVGDRYSAQWVVEQFRKRGVDYRAADRSKSELYLECLPIMNSGWAELLDHPRLTGQLCALERRSVRGGRDIVDHGPGGMDDLANAVAGALALCRCRRGFEGSLLDHALLVPSETSAEYGLSVRLPGDGTGWTPGPGAPGERARPGDVGYATSGGGASGSGVYGDASSPWFGEGW